MLFVELLDDPWLDDPLLDVVLAASALARLSLVVAVVADALTV